MKFHVEGASRTTGASVNTIVDADDEKTALATSNAMGILVSKIWSESSPLEALGDHVNRLKREPSLMEAMRGKFNGKPIDGVPEYAALKFVSSLLFAEAVCCYIGALICILMIPVVMLHLFQDEAPTIAEPIFLLGCALGAALIGGVIHGFSQAFLALRDIARNSFK